FAGGGDTRHGWVNVPCVSPIVRQALLVVVGRSSSSPPPMDSAGPGRHRPPNTLARTQDGTWGVVCAAGQLRGFDFVFLAAESSDAKAFIPGKLIEFGIPFVDVGMGIYEEGALGGILRTTTITPDHNDHVGTRISSGDGIADAYAQNIQIVELNALNAALTVIKWKKLLGFYLDDEDEHHTVYVIGGNTLI